MSVFDDIMKEIGNYRDVDDILLPTGENSWNDHPFQLDDDQYLPFNDDILAAAPSVRNSRDNNNLPCYFTCFFTQH